MQVLPAGAALMASALGYDILLASLRHAERGAAGTDLTETTWWFGYARDLVNLLGMAGVSVSFFFLGLRGPHALLAGGLMTILTYVLDYAFSRIWSLRQTALVLAVVTLGLAFVAVALRQSLAAGLNGFLALLFPVRA